MGRLLEEGILISLKKKLPSCCVHTPLNLNLPIYQYDKMKPAREI